MIRLLRLAVVFAIAGIAAFCRGGDSGPRTWALKSFTENEVKVEISVERDAAGHHSLTGRFTPTREGYHLYGKDLPKDGLNGIGRPTRLDIVWPAPGVHSAGGLEADRAPQPLVIDLLGLTFPVYPAGPVTLRHPVSFIEDRDYKFDLSVTYMACTEGTCLAPTIDRRFTVTVPQAATR